MGLRGATCRSAFPVLRHSESGPLSLSVCECRAAGSANGQTACPFIPYSTSLCPTRATRVLSAPVPVSAPPIQVWMYVSFLSTWCQTSLLFDFLSVLVVRGGAVCLPTLPSWLSSIYFLQGINVSYLVIHLRYMNKPLKVALFILHKVEEETAAKCHW